ncbi:MAG: aspartate-semialdehyde dehydrogenase [Sphaerochaetaceae bacterium]|jgi:aspartate-semialdehyde dehydrogenase|nr:aspartate-semialdehyde dehydrogenase [Sphaerochaetaceae bacterium]HHU88094.1 aspartate-semialdehyde dehydrogenase [Spirochaetales bacterium]
MNKIKAAVIGATGAVGQVFMWRLANHPWFEVEYITASAARVNHLYGSTVHWLLPFEMPSSIRGRVIDEFSIETMKERGVKIVFSALPANVAAEAEPLLRDNGFFVFSNASAMRYYDDVPILIPETNIETLSLIEQQGYPEKGFVVTNANCVTAGLAMSIAPFKKYGIKEIAVCSYQSVSGAGYPGLSSFDITDNCIPFIKGEEEKIEKEIKKILSIDPLVDVYCVRVPVMFGHLEAVWLTLEEELSLEQVKDEWDNFKEASHLPSTPINPVLYSAVDAFPQQKHAFWGEPQGMVVYTGRLKKRANKIGFVLLVNNLVKGAAGGSIQNAEAFVEKYKLLEN